MMSGFGLLVLIFFFGCADGFKNEKKDAFFDKWTTLAENSQGHSPSAKPKKIDTSALNKKQDSIYSVGRNGDEKTTSSDQLI